MKFPLVSSVLAVFFMVSGEISARPGSVAEALTEVRTALNDPQGDLGPLAKSLLGPQGGDAYFYFPTYDEPCTPATYGFRYETARFRSSDGTWLHGWFLPARGRNPKGTVVFSHGNAGSLGHHLGFALWWVEAGYHLFMYDYRGFGKSGGVQERRGMVDDVKAAFTHVSKLRGVDPARLISYGHSLGGAKSVAALAEMKVPGLRAVIVDGAFASYRGMARIMGGALAEDLVTDALAPRQLVGKLSPVPLLVVHGTDDEIVPVSQGRELYSRAVQPKTLFEVKAGRHGSALSADGGLYRKKVLGWLEHAVPPRARAVR